MDLRQLRYFTAIVEAGSLTLAAKNLHVAQPSLSVVVRNLEAEFNAALLERTPKGVRPTEAGEYLFDVGRRLLQDADNAGRHLSSLAEGRAGRLSLAITPTYSWAHLSGVLRRLAAEAPDIQVSLSDPPPLDIVELVRLGRAELGVLATYDEAVLASRYGEAFALRRICPLPLVAVLPPSFASAPEAVRLDDLRDEPWVVPTQSRAFPGMGALTEKLWEQLGWAPRVIREVSTSQTSLPIVAGGLGVAVMPASVTFTPNLSVVTRPIVDDIPDLQAVLAWRRGHRPSPAARRFMRLVLEGGEE